MYPTFYFIVSIRSLYRIEREFTKDKQKGIDHVWGDAFISYENTSTSRALSSTLPFRPSMVTG